MFSHQLHSIVQRDARVRDRFLGVYAADELPKRMPPKSLAIVNCCNRYYRGGHWLALYQDGKDALEIFDSYGLNPDIYNIILPQSAVVTYSGKQLQSIYIRICVGSIACIFVIIKLEVMHSMTLYLYFQKIIIIMTIIFMKL